MALTALKVKNAEKGRYVDGDGLRLDVDDRGNKAWTFRFTSPVTGKERYMGLGSARDVTLAEARIMVSDARALIREHKDPIEQRKEQRTAARVKESRSTTFKAYAEQFIGGREAAWKNPRHRQAWRNSLRDWAYPHIGDMAVADIDIDAVLKVLRPIWSTKTETASRVRGRIEAILNAAKVEKLRTGENPALWRGNLDHMLPSPKKLHRVEHHAALPFNEMPTFWKSLAADTSDAARMLRWIILTACRYGEAADIDAAEIKGDVWTVPAARMKGNKEHSVPLTPLALAQWPFRPVSDPALATCIRRHTKSPATTHGMRSTFRDWAGDITDHSRELAETALAHSLGEVERAYRRGTALAKRRELMEDWAAYCASA